MAQLCAFLGPALARIRLLESLRHEDAPREVMTRVLEKLERDDAEALRQYLDWRTRHPGKTVQDWLLIVLTNAARELVRQRRGRGKREGLSRMRAFNELLQLVDPVEPSYRPPVTPQQTAREIVEFSRSHLPPPQLAALEQWLQGAELHELAASMSLDSKEDAYRLVRAAIATLRRRFGEAPQEL
ncbi:MAG: hypothetical protein IPG04_20580 [Polyangiaceae bacterium]|nr:hypothetical protein [Polyangiaceae bacterium]